jgi:RNA polymerase sigma-70 factor (ECF subfamily)
MAQDPSFDELMSRLRAGDDEAARRVFGEYTERLIALARGRLGERLRRKVDPEDVLQSVYKSFFLRQARGQLRPKGWEGLWALLAVLTLRKCGRWVRRFRTGMRDVRAEVPADDVADGWEAVARGPAPEEAAMLTELVERLLQGLEGLERDVVALALQGATVAQISSQVGRTRRTVQRVLKRTHERLEQMAGEG